MPLWDSSRHRDKTTRSQQAERLNSHHEMSPSSKYIFCNETINIFCFCFFCTLSTWQFYQFYHLSRGAWHKARNRWVLHRQRLVKIKGSCEQLMDECILVPLFQNESSCEMSSVGANHMVSYLNSLWHRNKMQLEMAYCMNVEIVVE